MAKAKEQKIEYLAPDVLIPYANNARTHSAEQVQQIAASIKEFGFTNPVLIDDGGGIIAGHGRVKAAQLLKMEAVPCLRLSGLTKAQIKAYILADNKLALNAGWDENLLKIELKGLADLNFDLSLTGFSELDIASITGDINFQAGTEDDQGKLDQLEPKMVNCPYCGKDFDSRGREIA